MSQVAWVDSQPEASLQLQQQQQQAAGVLQLAQQAARPALAQHGPKFHRSVASTQQHAAAPSCAQRPALCWPDVSQAGTQRHPPSVSRGFVGLDDSAKGLAGHMPDTWVQTSSWGKVRARCWCGCSADCIAQRACSGPACRLA